MQNISPNAPGTFMDPEKIISELDVKGGSLVADFGCGSGYFSIPFAKKTGDDGKVFSFDILPQALESVESKAKMAGVLNIAVKRVNLEKMNSTGLAEGSMDWVVLKDVLFQNDQKGVLLGEALRVLKDGGKVLIIDWKQEDSAWGPEKEKRIGKDEMLELIKKAGFSFEKEVGAGDFHYCLVARK